MIHIEEGSRESCSERGLALQGVTSVGPILCIVNGFLDVF